MTYVKGVIDGLFATNADLIYRHKIPMFCYHGNVDVYSAMDLDKQYVEEIPKLKDMDFTTTLLSAYQARYPCK